MKIVPQVDGDGLEGSICDTARMAEIVQDLLINLSEHHQHSEVPDAFATELENVIFAGTQLRDMVTALKAEYYADHEQKQRRKSAP